jgi:hypothetical protein
LPYWRKGKKPNQPLLHLRTRANSAFFVKAGKSLKQGKGHAPAFTQVIGQIALTYLQNYCRLQK